MGRSVDVGSVAVFRGVKADKAQVLKIGEETMEVFSAFEDWIFTGDELDKKDLLNECADVMQATCNLIAALGVDDFTPYMEACRRRNEKRGRM